MLNFDIYQYDGTKPWMAKITGRDGKYGFGRSFLRSERTDVSRSGRTCRHNWELEDGLYEVGGSKDSDGFVLVFVSVKTGEPCWNECSPERARAIADLLDAGNSFDAARVATKGT